MLVECNVSRNNHITWDVRPSKCCVKAHVALGQNVWRPCSKVMHKTFVPEDKCFEEFSHAHNAPGSLSVYYSIQILQLKADASKAESRAFWQTISRRIEVYSDFMAAWPFSWTSFFQWQ